MRVVFFLGLEWGSFRGRCWWGWFLVGIFFGLLMREFFFCGLKIIYFVIFFYEFLF